MGKYWDWYEVEFERMGGGKLSPKRLDEILESLREHVLDATAEFANGTRGLDEAERIAVKNLGSPALIIHSELETKRWERLPLWVAGIGLAWIAFWFCLSGDLWSMAMYLPALVIVPIAVFLVSLGRRNAKTWAMGGIVTSIGIVVGAVLCFGWINMGAAGGTGFLPKWHIASVSKNERELLENFKQDKLLIGEICDAFQVGDLDKAKTLIAHDGRWRILFASHFAGANHRWSDTGTFDEAQQAWNRDKSVLLRPVDSAIARSKVNLSAMRDPRAFDPKGIWMQNATSITGVYLAALLVLAAAHLLGVWITNLPIGFARRRWNKAI